MYKYFIALYTCLTVFFTYSFCQVSDSIKLRLVYNNFNVSRFNSYCVLDYNENGNLSNIYEFQDRLVDTRRGGDVHTGANIHELVGSVSYEYNDKKQLISISGGCGHCYILNSQSGDMRFQYNEKGQLIKSWRTQSPLTTTYGYNEEGYIIKEQTVNDKNSSLTSDYDFSYDKKGRIIYNISHISNIFRPAGKYFINYDNKRGKGKPFVIPGTLNNIINPINLSNNYSDINNVVEIYSEKDITRKESSKYEYKYNDYGYPIEEKIKGNGFEETWNLAYSTELGNSDLSPFFTSNFQLPQIFKDASRTNSTQKDIAGIPSPIKLKVTPKDFNGNWRSELTSNRRINYIFCTVKDTQIAFQVSGKLGNTPFDYPLAYSPITKSNEYFFETEQSTVLYTLKRKYNLLEDGRLMVTTTEIYKDNPKENITFYSYFKNESPKMVEISPSSLTIISPENMARITGKWISLNILHTAKQIMSINFFTTKINSKTILKASITAQGHDRILYTYEPIEVKEDFFQQKPIQLNLKHGTIYLTGSMTLTSNEEIKVSGVYKDNSELEKKSFSLYLLKDKN